MSDWFWLTDALPENERLVEATTPTGDVRRLRRSGNLFFNADMSLYMHFTPVKWRYLDGS